MTIYMIAPWKQKTVFSRLIFSTKAVRNEEEKLKMDHQVLLIAGTIHAQWGNVLQAAMGDSGFVQLATEQDYELAIEKKVFHLIIIDAGEISSFTEVVKEVKRLQPAAIIVVATASPTWQRAREAMRAGADDYIRKQQKESQLVRYLTQLMH